MQKGTRAKGSEAHNSEELRIKYALISNAWLFARARFGSRPWLKSWERNPFYDLIEYLFGPKCMKLLSAPLGLSKQRITPSWDVLYNFQHEIRPKAYELVREEGHTLKDALAAAMKDTEVRELHFTSAFGQEVAT